LRESRGSEHDYQRPSLHPDTSDAHSIKG
jgi:hypothetical protein